MKPFERINTIFTVFFKINFFDTAGSRQVFPGNKIPEMRIKTYNKEIKEVTEKSARCGNNWNILGVVFEIIVKLEVNIEV